MSKENENIQVVVVYQDSEENSHPAQELSSDHKEKSNPPPPIQNHQSEHHEGGDPKVASEKPLSHHSEKQKQPSVHEEPAAILEQRKEPSKENVDPAGRIGEEDKKPINEDKNGPFEQIIEVPVGPSTPNIESEKNEEPQPRKEEVRVEAAPEPQREHQISDHGVRSHKNTNLNNLFEVADYNQPVQSSENLVPPPNRVDAVKESETSSEVPELESSEEQTSQKANRIVGIIILALIGGIFWIYGWASEFHVVTSSSSPVSLTTQPIYAGLLISTAIFVVIGFGLLFMFFKKTGTAALFSSLFIVSFTMLYSPIFHKYWYNVFVTDFSGTVISAQSPSYFLNMSMGNTNILLDLYNLKFSLITSISQLVVLLSMFGKLSYLQIATFSFFYNFLWPLNHYGMINVQNKSPDPRFFDDYQISSVYLFGACFGSIAMLILKKPPVQDYLETSSFSSIFAYIGTFFLYLSFCATTILFTEKNSDSTLQRNFVWQEAFISCFFALSASTLSSFTFSILFNDKIEARVSVFGVLVGGILFGSIAGFCSNIGAAIACGFGAGLITNLYFSFIYYKINSKRIIDNYGVLLILIVSLLATVVIAPIVLATYRKFDIVLAPLQSSASNSGTVIANKEVAGYSLAYPAISAFIGCSSGLILGLVLKLMDKLDADKTLTDKLYFELSHGLRPTKEKKPQKKKGQDKNLKKSINKTHEKQLRKRDSNPPRVVEDFNQEDKPKQPSVGPVFQIVHEHSSNRS